MALLLRAIVRSRELLIQRGNYVLDFLLSRLFSRKKKATLTTRLSITNGAETRLEK